jgi:hypothetical protein
MLRLALGRFLESPGLGQFDQRKVEDQSGGEPQLPLEAVEPGVERLSTFDNCNGSFLRGMGFVGFGHCGLLSGTGIFLCFPFQYPDRIGKTGENIGEPERIEDWLDFPSNTPS